MANFNFSEFHSNLQKDFAEASRLVSDIENEMWETMLAHAEGDFENDDEEEFNKRRLSNTLESIKLKLDFAHEYLGLTRLSETFNKALAEYTGKYAELEFIPYVDVFHSPVQAILTKHLNALTSHISIESESEYENTNSLILLEQILRGTPKILFDRKIEPHNEAEVRNEVYKILIHVFPDTVREIPIAKVSKTYKPDVGVKRLKSAVEYKFVDTETEAKTAIGGVFEDIQGYHGSEDWTTFYAVIYMTDNFMTQAQVEAEFKLSKVPHHWKPIVVFGKGHRIKKSTIGSK
jgi:hypothetical protein